MLEAGHQVGRYEVEGRVGRGGMGTVYLANDPVLGRRVAIKVFLGELDLPDARERFIREARSAAALNHANIVTIHDFGEFSSQPFIVMEYIGGETLAETIRARRVVPVVEKLRWLEDLCGGVAYAHENGVLHRDIKPSNLIIDRSGRLKILDFGVARMVGTGTKATALIGTPGYMAPEQILGDAVDARSDVFSIGVVAYELLSYTEAFPGETMPTISHRVLNVEPVSIAAIVPDIQPDLAAVVTRALQKSMDARYPDATSLRQAFGRVRRHLELYGASDSSTVLLSRVPTRPADGLRATPPAAPRSNTSRVASAVARARVQLDAGDLNGALESCEQALAIDEANGEALAIQQAIRAAAARQHARALLQDAERCIAAQTLAEAQELIEQARSLDPNSEECARMQRALHVAQISAQASAMGAPSAGETVVIPARRTPMPPLSPRPPSSGGSARPPSSRGVTPPTPGDEAARPTPVARERQTSPKPPPRSVAVTDRLRAVTAATAQLLPWLRTRNGLIVAAAVAVLAIGGAAAALLRPAPVSMGTLVVDAAPWAVITAIRSDDGQEQAVPADAGTPMTLALPLGRYTITLTGPMPNGESRMVTVDITSANGVTSAPVERFGSITAEEYFGQYLSSSAGSPR